MSKKAIVGLVCVFALGIATTASAHTPEGEIFFAVQFPNNYIPQIDGDISEWDVVPETPLSHSQRSLGGSRSQHSDCAARFAGSE